MHVVFFRLYMIVFLCQMNADGLNSNDEDNDDDPRGEFVNINVW